MDIILESVKQAKKGDQEAFGRLYDELADRLFRYIKIKVQNQEQAEDILQDVFIKIWKNLGQFEEEGGYFQAWVYRIATNCVNDYFRKMYRSPVSTELDEQIDIPSGQNLQHEVADRLETDSIKLAFNYLKKDYKAVLELRFIQDLSLDDTARVLNKTNLAVRVLQHRALKSLKAILKEKDDIRHSKIQ